MRLHPDPVILILVYFSNHLAHLWNKQQRMIITFLFSFYFYFFFWLKRDWVYSTRPKNSVVFSMARFSQRPTRQRLGNSKTNIMSTGLTYELFPWIFPHPRTAESRTPTPYLRKTLCPVILTAPAQRFNDKPKGINSLNYAGSQNPVSSGKGG